MDMRKPTAVLALAVILAGCSDSNVDKVKNGTLNFDKSLTIGQAITNYKYFKKTRWESLTTENGKKVVQVVGLLDKESHPLLNSKKSPSLKSVELLFQFKINVDDSFDLSWCGIRGEKTNGSKFETEEKTNLLKCVKTLQNVYDNSPDV